MWTGTVPWTERLHGRAWIRRRAPSAARRLRHRTPSSALGSFADEDWLQRVGGEGLRHQSGILALDRRVA